MNVRCSATAALLVAASLTAACNSGSDAPGPAPPPDYNDGLEAGDVRFHIHPDDPVIATSVTDMGERVSYLVERAPDGQVIRTAGLVHRSPWGETTSIELDDEGRAERLTVSGMGGLSIGWPTDEIAHVRVFDVGQQVVEELWFDTTTGQPTDPPESSGDGAAGWAAPQTRSASDTTTVRALVRDCNGAVSARAAAMVERASLEFDLGGLAFDLPMEREDSSFVARLPRQLTSAEIGDARCEDLLAWFGDFCHLVSDVQVGTLLTSMCASAVHPIAIAACTYAMTALQLACFDGDRVVDLLCSGGALIFNLGEAFWGQIDGERRVTAVARLRTCEGIVERRSETRTVNAATSFVQLELDACVPNSETSWFVVGGADSAGAFIGSTESLISVLDLANPLLGYQPTGLTAVDLGPTTLEEECFWPHSHDPIDIVVAGLTGGLHGDFFDGGGVFSSNLAISRRIEAVRPPTQAEIDAGIPDGVTVCLEEGKEMTASFAAFLSVPLKPFQRAVVRVDVSGSTASADATSVLSLVPIWPPASLGGPPGIEVTGDGTYEFVLTHDDLRRAAEWMSSFGNFDPPPGFPQLPNLNLDFGSQCYTGLIGAAFSTELEVSTNIDGQAASGITYSVEILPEY